MAHWSEDWGTAPTAEQTDEIARALNVLAASLAFAAVTTNMSRLVEKVFWQLIWSSHCSMSQEAYELWHAQCGRDFITFRNALLKEREKQMRETSR